MDSILKYAQKAQKAYNHYGKSEVEVKVLEATGKENWGVHGQAMKDIARHTRNRSDCGEIMRTLWQRLEHRGDEWRHVYKALTLMEFLVAHGDESVTRQLQQNIYEIERLENFQYKEPSGRDQGINVRQKCQTLVKLLKDPTAIAEVRDKAIANQNKYGGISSDQARGGNIPRATAPANWNSNSSSSGGFNENARSAPHSGRTHHTPPAPRAAAPAAASTHGGHTHGSSQPNFASFDDDDDDDFEDTNAATAGPKSGFVPKIIMSTPGANNNPNRGSIPSSPAPLAPPPGSAGHSRRNTASGTSGDIFADFGMTSAAAGTGSNVHHHQRGKPAAATDLFGAAPVSASADPFAAAPVAAPAQKTATEPDLFGDFGSSVQAKPAAVDPFDLYNAPPAPPAMGAGMGMGIGGGMSPGPSMMGGGMGNMGGMNTTMGGMGMNQQMGGMGMNPQMGGMGMNPQMNPQMGGMGGMGSPAPQFAPKRAPPADPFNTSAFGSQPSPPPKPGRGHKKNSSSGDVLSDLTSGMMGMGMGKKQGTGTPMKAGGKGGASLLDF